MNEQSKETQADRIKRRREDLHLTQKELADRTGVNSQTVYKWEAEKQGVKGDNLNRLAQALSVSADWILSGGDDPPSPSRDGPSRTRRLLDDILELIKQRPDQVDLNEVILDFALAQRCVTAQERIEALRDERRQAQWDGELIAERDRQKTLRHGGGMKVESPIMGEKK